MGLRKPPVAIMDWMSTLGRMKEHGTIIKASCVSKTCGYSREWPVDDLIAELGSDKASVWDRRPPCDRCDGDVIFLACAGQSTPCRPLISQNVPREGLPIQSLMDGWVGLGRQPRR